MLLALFGGRRTVLSALPLLLAGAALSAVRVTALDESIRKQVEAWRAKHEAAYRREWVPLAGLFPLRAGSNTAGSALGSDVELPRRAPARIGRFVLDGRHVRFEPESGVAVALKGRPVKTPVVLTDDEDGKQDELTLGDIALWVHLSGERLTIRMRDPKGETARSFRGFTWFPIDDSYRVVGRFKRDPAPRVLHTPNQAGDEDEMTTDGVVEFMLHGESIRLRPMAAGPNQLWFIFRDGTSGKETYETARFLYADLKPDGTTVLDFNEAYNPPCAFNPYTTCPLPLPENRLSVRIAAGERAYSGH